MKKCAICSICLLLFLIIGQAGFAANKGELGDCLELKYRAIVIEESMVKPGETTKGELSWRPNARFAAFEIITQKPIRSGKVSIISVSFRYLCVIDNGVIKEKARIPPPSVTVLIAVNSAGEYLGFKSDLKKNTKAKGQQSNNKKVKKRPSLFLKNQVDIIMKRIFINKEDKIAEGKHRLHGIKCEKLSRTNTELFFSTELKRILRSDFTEIIIRQNETIKKRMLIECSKEDVFRYWHKLKKNIGRAKNE